MNFWMVCDVLECAKPKEVSGSWLLRNESYQVWNCSFLLNWSMNETFFNLTNWLSSVLKSIKDQKNSEPKSAN